MDIIRVQCRENFIEKTLIIFLYLFAIASAVSITLTTVILAIFSLIYLVDFKNNIRKTPRDFILFLILYIWKAVTLIFNGLFVNVFSRFFHGIWDKLPYIFGATFNIEKDKIIRFIEILLWTNAVILAYAILQKFFGFPPIVKSLFDPGLFQFKGYHSNPLRFAGYYSTVCLIAFTFCLFYSRKYLVFVLLLFFGLLLNGSRTYWFSVTVTLVVLSLIKSKRAFLITILSIFISVVFFFTLFPTYYNRIKHITKLDESLGVSHLTLRMNFWKACLEITQQDPIFGVGEEETKRYLKPYMDMGKIDNTSHCHNTYLTVMAENGIIGLLMLLGIYFYFLQKYWLRFKVSQDSFSKTLAISVFAVLINIAFSGLSEHNLDTFVLWGFTSFYMGVVEGYFKRNFNP